ncbi:MAG TPA: hypothetical protein VFL76_07055 [Edaphocola sp.]|nr:hypothetical protein [Edaphocola sp.]
MRSLYIILSIGLLAGCRRTSPKLNEHKQVGPENNNTGGKHDSLSVTISRNDTLDPADSLYGVGDDDLFTANEPEFYKIKDGKWKVVSGLINDYDLTTSVDGQLSHNQPDTFSIIVTFPGIAHDPDKTLPAL